MHHIYQTEGIVLSSTAFGEANKHFWIFTRDLGMITASAQGVRHLKSKLRYSLQDFSHGTLSLVRGKGGWRITNAAIESNISADLRGNPPAAAVAIQGLRLLKRLLPGEEGNPELFSIMSSALACLRSEELSAAELQSVEMILILRILRNLGYFPVRENLVSFSESAGWGRELLSGFEAHRKEALDAINASLRQTQL